jgi:hypothetical protein
MRVLSVNTPRVVHSFIHEAAPALPAAMPLQMVSIVSSQLDEWAAAGPINLAAEGKSLSFEFSTKLLVSPLCVQGG